MRKILFLFLFFPTILSAQTEIVNIGSSPNDGTGDPLRTAFQKINTNRAATVDSFGVHNTKINDIRYVRIPGAIQYEKDHGVDFHEAIQAELQSFVGTGGSVGMYELKGIVGTTAGFPENNDSLIIHTSFIDHPHIQVYRNGLFQWQNASNANAPNGYRFNASTGTLVFKPLLATGDLIVVHAFDPIIWHDLVPQGGSGGGGEPGGSTLLDDLMFYYAMNETSGSVMTDATGTQNGGTNATVNQAGRIGRCFYFTGDNATAYVPYNASQVVDGNHLSISLWVRLDDLPSATGHVGYLYREIVSSSPYEAVYLTVGTDNRVHFNIKNRASTDFHVESSTILNDSDWYHVVAVVDGEAALKLYVNGSDVSRNAESFSGLIYQSNSFKYMGNAYNGADSWISGWIDEVAGWSKALSGGEITSLYNSGAGRAYPFN